MSLPSLIGVTSIAQIMYLYDSLCIYTEHLHGSLIHIIWFIISILAYYLSWLRIEVIFPVSIIIKMC